MIRNSKILFKKFTQKTSKHTSSNRNKTERKLQTNMRGKAETGNVMGGITTRRTWKRSSSTPCSFFLRKTHPAPLSCATLIAGTVLLPAVPCHTHTDTRSSTRTCTNILWITVQVDLSLWLWIRVSPQSTRPSQLLCTYHTTPQHTGIVLRISNQTSVCCCFVQKGSEERKL